jgi:hypothetical protein
MNVIPQIIVHYFSELFLEQIVHNVKFVFAL